MNLFEKGWICPRCEAVMSPTTKCCVNCRGKTQTQTTSQEIAASPRISDTEWEALLRGYKELTGEDYAI